MRMPVSRITTVAALTGLALAMPFARALAGDLPASHKEGAITYITGGIEQKEADAIKHVAKYYPLELEFLVKAKPRDEYLSDVKVRIKDAHDKMVLNVTSGGPFLLAKMPAGKYTVNAEYSGRMEHRNIEVAAKQHRRVVFEWQS